MADKPVLVIDVDTSQFDAFEAKFQAYTEAVQASPAAWGETDKAVKEVGTSFDAALGEMLKMNAAMIDPNLGKAFTGIQALSIGTSKAWRLIAQDSEKSLKSMSGMARLAAGLRTFGIGALSGVLAIGGAAAAATIGTAKDLSDENRQNRELGLPSGEAKAFDDQYGATLGASSSDLSRFADIKNNQGEWSKLINATNGKVNYENIQKDDPVELYLKSVRAAGETYRDMGPAGGQWAESQGANALFGSGTVRNASTRDDSFWNKQHQQYTEERDKIAIGQPALDQSTAFEQKWQADLSVLKRDFEGAIVPLEPIFIKLATGGTNLIDAFAKSPDLKKGVDSTIEMLEKFEKGMEWGASKLNALFPGSKDDKHDVTVDKGSFAANAVQEYYNLKKAFQTGHFDSKTIIGDLNTPGYQAPAVNFDYMWNSPETKADEEKRERKEPKDKPATDNTNGKGDSGKHKLPGGSDVGSSEFVRDPDRVKHLNELEVQHHFPKGYLAAHEHMESSDGKNNLNPKNPNVLGAFQFDEPTAKKYDVNRFDEYSSMKGAAQLLEDLYKKYGDREKASAAYDGDTHIDQDGKDWLAKAKQETKDQNKYLRDHVADFLPKGPTQADVDSASKAGDSKAADDSSSAPNGYPFKNPAPSTQMSPIALNLNVVAPSGSNVFTSVAGMALV